MGIISCEVQLLGCLGSGYLGFAHVDKRRHLADDELDQVVLACVSCHKKLDHDMDRFEMREKVEKIIKLRRV